LKKGGATFTKRKNSLIHCGNSYFVAGSGTMTCEGDSCQPGNVCAPQFFTNPSVDDKSKMDCLRGTIAGKIYHSGFAESMNNWLEREASEGWQWVTDNEDPRRGWTNAKTGYTIQIQAVCNNGDREYELGADSEGSIKKDEKKKEQYYVINVSDLESKIEGAKSDCSSNDGLKGFVLEVSFSESGMLDTYENHYIGKQGTTGVDLADKGVFGGIVTGAANTVFASAASTNYMITEDDLRKGVVINIDAKQVHDIDEDSDRSVYVPYGYVINNTKK
jgi:hypothetical protein